MTVMRRSPDRWETFVYVPVRSRKEGEGPKRYLGCFPSEAVARDVEQRAKRGEYDADLRVRQPSVRWSLNEKGETACRVCDGEAKHLHHTIPRASLGDRKECPFRGGIPLCVPCHIGWHHNAVTIFRDHLHPEEIAYIVEVMGGAWLDLRYPARELYAQDINQDLVDEVVRLRKENLELRRRLDQ
jgi:hypothetical protein